MKTLYTTKDQYDEINKIRNDPNDYRMYWEIVRDVMNLNNNELFIWTSQGTSSQPKDGLIITIQ
jgi:hypothetical protein